MAGDGLRVSPLAGRGETRVEFTTNLNIPCSYLLHPHGNVDTNRSYLNLYFCPESAGHKLGSNVALY